jgi:hypothetical protein
MEIFFKLFNDQRELAGIISYTLNAGTYRENVITGNISRSNRPYNQSVANSIYDMDDFEEASTNQVNSDFPYEKDWEVEEFPEEELEEVKEEVELFLNHFNRGEA